jgi:hypothetical protein
MLLSIRSGRLTVTGECSDFVRQSFFYCIQTPAILGFEAIMPLNTASLT